MSTALDVHTWELAENGYTVLDGIHTDEEAAEALRTFGELVPQYDGSLRYQVKAAPGFEERRYSKSVNTILVHTEAPGWNPPPSYLALHCRVQATCGSGHTELADMRRFVDSLSEKDRAALHERGIEWLGHNTGGVGTEGVLRPVVERTDSGREILRFSYNLLTTGQYDPPVDASVDPAELPLGSFGVHLAEQAEEFFRQEKISVLIPEDSVLVWDNQRMVHARSAYRDAKRHLTRYWIDAQR
ncbi:TauD/TfdA family dioxygenase [Streptomyces rubiginosohelvolus]|uniref:TauD/TfdA family dioxygenase n=1 Tax=Streptomyces TaxID=1883 RepID=UPI0021B465A5|nr:TauD/TfdA family dioxygenase [Streptomyces sp. CS-7]MCT6777198.1 TauD/TfdA family dioxygenase [Streptomyces sp. CS-7]